MNKTVLHVICFLLFAFSLKAQQNLVYNGDMEEYSSCPNTFSYPAQSIKEIEKCTGWTCPTYGTSDYYNSCAIGTDVHIPVNPMGKQSAFSGNGYLGSFFVTLQGGAGNDGYSGIMWWEYVQGQLIAPLEQGKTYTFSMEISLAEISDLAINEIGVYFSNTPITSPNTAALTVLPQIIFHNPDYFKDTINWVHLEAFYVAEGGEKYLTIGNFRDNVITDTLRITNYEPVIPNPCFTYFYIDNVMLTDSSQEPPNEEELTATIFTPNGDCINDVWKAPFKSMPENSRIFIVNRWGNIVYEAAGNGFTWDGTTQNGTECADGVYFYRLSNTNKTGFIQLVR